MANGSRKCAPDDRLCVLRRRHENDRRRFASGSTRLNATPRCPTGKSIAWRCARRLESLTRSPARKSKFPQSFQRDFSCPVLREKIFCFLITPNQWLHLAIPPHRRGVSRSSRTWRRDAVDASAAADDWRARGRPSRVVLTSSTLFFKKDHKNRMKTKRLRCASLEKKRPADSDGPLIGRYAVCFTGFQCFGRSLARRRN